MEAGQAQQAARTMNLPRWNRLTGWNWRRWSRKAHESEAAVLDDELRVSAGLQADCPFAAGKIGTTELMVLEYFDRAIQLPWPKSASWRRPTTRLYECSGFFPIDQKAITSWIPLYVNSLGELDLVAEWQTPGTFLSAYEDRFLAKSVSQATRISLNALHPVHPPAAWLPDLCALRWLVISPFAATIRSQLPHLGNLGIYPPKALSLLPKVASDCQILRCPQLPYLEPPVHRDWFEALEEMKLKMEAMSFDIALVGAGAWSLPLVAHAKKLGKKGLHFGGQLQLLFGIKGGRWERGNFYNQAWIRPLPEERPANYMRMENGAYW
ncbi:hypothetical protein EBX31_07910 [bacterium]|nr:hypothetical protein [bacterium]